MDWLSWLLKAWISVFILDEIAILDDKQSCLFLRSSLLSSKISSLILSKFSIILSLCMTQNRILFAKLINCLWRYSSITWSMLPLEMSCMWAAFSLDGEKNFSETFSWPACISIFFRS